MIVSRFMAYSLQHKNIFSSTTSISAIKTIYYSPVNSFHLKSSTNQKAVTKSEQSGSDRQIQVSFGEKVKENTKSAWYLSVIIGGVAVTGLMFYAIFRELFSSKSPNSVYARASDYCINDPRVINILGEPIKAYGEETRRGRRGHVMHSIYEKDGAKHIRMKFYLQGSRKKATAHLEMKENANGKWIYRYLFIQTDDILKSVTVLEDNRDVEV
ncbi:hypothetical protein TKK_0003556 [Trichogramma kaykai]|uniref:Mitochondrial import inner membrane translocase subunit Tim21 n=1 Tax=Trichogramma kaykai TaxID=54128 RepID=A0ABD2XPM2_9HYME